MGEQDDEPQPWDDCPVHAGIECEYDTCTCTCDDCQDPDLDEEEVEEK